MNVFIYNILCSVKMLRRLETLMYSWKNSILKNEFYKG
jgi:hypothetical protein